MEIIVKQGSGPRIDHPSRLPDQKKAEAVAARNYANMEFENDAQRRDYLRRVNSNPGFNLPGLPEFYPPEKIRSVGGLGHPMPMMDCGHRAFRIKSRFDAGTIVNILTCPEGHVEETREEAL